MVCVSVVIFPQPSSKLHNLKIIIEPSHGLLFKTLSTKVASPSAVKQLSNSSITSPVKFKSLGFCSQSKEISAGTEKTGGIVSINVIDWVSIVVFPHSSAIVQILSIVPAPTQFPSAVKISV